MLDVKERGRKLILSGQNLHDTLRGLARLAEEKMPGAMTGYTLVDDSRSFITEAVFPTLPPMFEKSISAIPLDRPVGTCVQALRTRTPVVSTDVLADARFDVAWRDMCLRCGINAVKSIPFGDAGDPVEGTFVVGYPQATQEAGFDSATMQLFADLGRDAIRLYRSLSVPTTQPQTLPAE